MALELDRRTIFLVVIFGTLLNCEYDTVEF